MENRLTKVTLPAAQGVVEYAYDGDGKRVETKVTKSGATATTKHLVDRNRAYAEVVEERDGSGGLIARFIHGHDLEGPVSVTDGVGSTKYYLTDALGSTRFLTDATGAVTDSYLYDAYGVETARTGTTYNPYRFTGEAFDEDTKLTYLRARWLDSRMGRFLTADTWSGRPTQPISLNQYIYGDSNPVLKRDPTGRMSLMVATSFTVTTIVVGVTLLDNSISAPHAYLHFSPICPTAFDYCTKKNAFNALRQFPAPIGTLGYGLGRMVNDQGERLELWGLLSTNPVFTTHNGVDAVKNRSLPGHLFQGTVDRKVTVGSAGIGILTKGEGRAPRALTNMLAAPAIWTIIDAALARWMMAE